MPTQGKPPTGGRTVSAAGVHRADWAQKANQTKREYKKAAEGKAPEKATPVKSGKGGKDKPRSTHDLEPSIADKNRGAAMTRGRPSRVPKARTRPTRGRGPGLER